VKGVRRRAGRGADGPGSRAQDRPAGGADRLWGDAVDRPVAAVCGLGDPVRRGLYEFVSQRNEAVGRDEAATGVGIGRPLAAYHLDKLCELGLLTASYRRPTGRGGPGAGRPAKVYARSSREFAVTLPPREYELAGRLLAEAVDADRAGAAGVALLRAARRAGADLGRAAAAGGRAGTAVVSVLAEHGFEPARDAAGAIRLRNCPFHQLAADHPDVICGMNLALVAGLLDGLLDGLGAKGTLQAALDPRPGHCCVVIESPHDTQSSGAQ
jgi:predicted ArsR family transcriptional regulator